jgi:hypothetical protein
MEAVGTYTPHFTMSQLRISKYESAAILIRAETGMVQLVVWDGRLRKRGLNPSSSSRSPTPPD